MGDGDLTTADLEALVASARELTAEIGLAQLLPRILDRAGALTGSLDGSVILHDRSRDALYFAAATGDNAPVLLNRWGELAVERIPVQGSVAGQVFASGRSTIVTRVPDAPAHFKGVDEITQSATESILCVPLVCGSDRLGVMQLRNAVDRSYSERDRILLERFADVAATAIRNAQLFRRLLAHMGLFAAKDSKHDPSALLDELHAPARSERLTIFFADMRGFSQLCQVADTPEDVRVMLSEFIGMLSAEIIAEKGIVNKVIGDGLLALFRHEDHARRAVRAAFRIVEGTERVKKMWLRRTNFDLHFIDVGIGIVTDTVILGTVGVESGVLDFTPIGTPVVLAARFQTQARGDRRILVDRMTFNAVEDFVEAELPPKQIELRKAGQTIGKTFDQYHLKALKGEAAAVSGQAAPAAVVRPRVRESVFISYSHDDAEWLERLQNHLKPYVRTGTVNLWDDTRLTPGTLWRPVIDAALASASVAVLLVTPNFLASDFIANHEVAPLLDAARVNRVPVIWVAVSASSYEETELREYQAANDPEKPLDSLSLPEQNLALVKICKKIKQAVQAASL